MLDWVSSDSSGDGHGWMGLKYILEIELTGHADRLGVW